MLRISQAEKNHQNKNQESIETSKELFDCLEPLLKALNWSGTRQHLIDALPHFTNVITIDDFINIMKILHFKVNRIKVPLNDLDNRLLPCLYITDSSNIWVILRKENGAFHYFDARKNAEFIAGRLNQKGTAYSFRQESSEELASGIESKNWFKDLIAQYNALIRKIFLFTMVVSFLGFGLPIYSISVYDFVIPANSALMATTFLIGILIIVIASICVQAVNTNLMVYLGSKVDNTIGKSVFERLLYLPTFYTENSPVSAQVERIKDFNNIRDLFTAQLINLFFELPFTLLFLLGIIILGGKLAYIPLGSIIIFSLLILFLTPIITRFVKDSAKESSKRQSLLLESFQNARVIKLMAIENVWLARFRQASLDYLSKNAKTQVMTGLVNSFSDTLIYISATLIIGIGASEVIEGKLTTGILIAIMMLTWRVLMPLKTIFSSQIRLRQIVSSISQVNALMAIPPEREPGYLGESIQGLTGKITFNRVSFRYPNALEYSLMGINFTSNQGEMYAIAGRNGAGKTSMLNLLLGLYKPTSGTLLIENQDIRQFDPIEYRKSIGYIPQNCQAFFGTIAQNICLTKITATTEEMIEAAKKAYLYDDIEKLARGFDTPIGDQTHSLLTPSFLKRIALARVYLKNPAIILIDEPTDLDEKGDRAFMDALEFFRKKATIFLATHRPSHFKLADKILLLHEGQLVMSGPSDKVLLNMPKEFLQ